MYKHVVKPCFDVLLAFSALIVLAPLFLGLCVVVKLSSSGPIFFVQQRVGKDNRLFRMVKFRTMHTRAPKDCPAHLLENPTQHITRAGHFLRRSALDELPQLLNVIALQMSLVGPRPALWNQLDLIAAREQNGANSIKPGLTGLAQVSGRGSLRVEEKAHFDGLYAKQLSFALDMRCIWHTAAALRGDKR